MSIEENITPTENKSSNSEDSLVFESELRTKPNEQIESGSANESKNSSMEEVSVFMPSQTEKTQAGWQKFVKTLSTIIWSVVIILILLQLTGRFAINQIKANAQPETAVTMTVPIKVTPLLSSEISASPG